MTPDAAHELGQRLRLERRDVALRRIRALASDLKEHLDHEAYCQADQDADAILEEIAKAGT